MKLLTTILFSILLIATTGFINHTHLVGASDEEQIKQLQQELQKEFDSNCSKNPHLYAPGHVKAKAWKKAESIFNILGDNDQEFSADLQKGDFSRIWSNFSGEILSSILLWIVLFVGTFIFYIFIIYNIFCVNKKRTQLKKNHKIILIILLIIFAGLIVWQSIDQYYDGTEKELIKTVDTVDCVFLYNTLNFVRNSDSKTFENWSGLMNYNDNLQSINTFFSKSISASPFKELGNSKLFDSATSALNNSVKSVGAVKPKNVALTNPDPTAKAKTENSTYLQSLQKSQQTLNKDIGGLVTEVKKDSTNFQKISTGFANLSKASGPVLKKIKEVSQKAVSYSLQVSQYTKAAHDKIVEQRQNIKDYYNFLQQFFFWNKVIIALAGSVGFLILSVASETGIKNIGGNFMHFSWCYGTIFFFAYIIICASYFLFGVTIQEGYCRPLNQIAHNNEYITKVWKNSNPEVQDILEQCVYNKTQSLESTFDIGASAINKQATDIQKTLSTYSANALTNPKSLGDFKNLQTTCTKISGDYGLAVDGKKDISLAGINSWTDFNQKGSQQNSATGGGATCKVTQDIFAFTKKDCGKYPVWTSKDSEALDGKQHCFLVDGTLPADLNTKRYVAAKFSHKEEELNIEEQEEEIHDAAKKTPAKKTPKKGAKPASTPAKNKPAPQGCSSAIKNSLGKTVDAIDGAYAKQLYAYQNDVKTNVVSLCKPLGSVQTEVPNDITSANKVISTSKTSVQKASPALKSQLTDPMSKLTNTLDCGFVDTEFIVQLKGEICGYTEDVIYSNYVNWVLTALMFLAYLTVISLLSFFFFRKYSETKIMKSDFPNINNNLGMSKTAPYYDHNNFGSTPQRNQEQDYEQYNPEPQDQAGEYEQQVDYDDQQQQ